MRKPNLYYVFVLTLMLLSACNFPGSDSYVETQVADALATKAVQDTQEALVVVQTQQAEAIALTETANAYANQTATALAAITATSSPTPTLNPTDTPAPTYTPAGSGIPEGQMVVVAKSNAAWWKKKGENNAGFPVMIKLNPVQRYEPGDTFRVYDYQIRADGNVYFYQIAGPLGAGYFVRTGDVNVK